MPPAYEYRRATWAEVAGLGPAGWRLVPVPPVQEVRQVLGQPQVSEPLYVMEREIPAAGTVDEGLGFAVRNDLPRVVLDAPGTEQAASALSALKLPGKLA